MIHSNVLCWSTILIKPLSRRISPLGLQQRFYAIILRLGTHENARENVRKMLVCTEIFCQI